MYRRGERWLGIICCFVLFILVFLSLHLSVTGRFIATGHMELGCLFFVLPGAVASFFAKDGKVVGPLTGAMLALPLCLVLVHTTLTPVRSFWQEVAWLFSAVFWTSLGSLGFLLINMLRKRSVSTKKPAR
ncbi:inner membrane protein YbjM [Enterobacteriaceae bacterium H18W14]|uniref:inner membrane protein YbjM n=1 Tax=Dryocola boscaweniae TaxID=2925397 RepID=UPI0022F05196|nr:inner membrane protein YbjM [Dryocola boscaweniae]MCT4715992.1 inner membrane protein YbjM [Dryocola boscaweniae]